MKSVSLLDATSRAMAFWFKHDFTVADCLGGKCRCSSSGFWNSNWFSNVSPSQVCLLHCQFSEYSTTDYRYPKAGRRELPPDRHGQTYQIAGGRLHPHSQAFCCDYEERRSWYWSNDRCEYARHR